MKRNYTSLASNKSWSTTLLTQKTHSKPNYKRSIIWFKPLFNRNVSTKIGKYFLNLLDKNFLRNHRLHKIFNRNSIKVSYSCTKNMKTKINDHNTNILGKKPLIDASTCNCRNKEDCPLNGQCQIGEVVYESTVTSNQQSYKDKKYFGLQKNLSKDAYTSTIYLWEMNFIRTKQKFLRNSGKSRWRITPRI